MMGIGSNHCELAAGMKVFLSAAILVRTRWVQEKLLQGNRKITKICIFFIRLLREGQGPVSVSLQPLAKNIY